MSAEQHGTTADLTASERRELLASLLRARAGRARPSFSQERLWFLVFPLMEVRPQNSAKPSFNHGGVWSRLRFFSK